MALAPGTRLGPYEIVSSIGAGGMGEVYRARDTRLGREVAVKVLPAQLARDPERLARFEREARAVAALSHANVLAIYDYGKEGDVAWAVTELLEGRTLREHLASGPIPPREALDLAMQLARGLAAAHGKGIVHRDVKPENLFVTRDGTLKVLDFGLSREAAPDRAVRQDDVLTLSGVTSPGTVMGTVGYMSPEQARGLPTDLRTDLFGAGCVLYEMLSGRRAFAGETPADTLAALLQGEPEPLSPRSRNLPAGLEAVVRRCLAKRPEERYPSAQELLGALEVVAEPARGASSGFASDAGAAPAPSRGLSLVVLPFEDLSPGRDSEYFSDGLTEEILGDLSKIRSLRVISRTSSMALKGTRKDLRTIAGELAVRFVLEGSVRRAGNNLRIGAQLIDADADAPLWSEKFAGTLDDVFDIQEKVSRAITDALELTLSPSEERRMSARPIASIQVYECFLRARRAMQFLTREGLAEAERLLREGLELGGESALLCAGLARVHFERVNQCLRGADGLEEAETWARRALALDPETATAHLVLGLVQHFRGDLPGCLRHVDRALASDPNDADILWWKTWFTAWNLGRPAAARPYARRAMELDPGNPLSHVAMAWVELCDGRPGEAYDRVRAAVPTLEAPAFRIGAAAILVFAQREEEALALLAPIEPIEEYEFFSDWGFLMKVALRGRRERLPEAMKPSFVALAGMDPCLAYLTGSSLARLGLEEEALGWLERAVSRGFWNHALLARHDPFLQGLRGTPRFERLLRQVHVEQEKLGG